MSCDVDEVTKRLENGQRFTYITFYDQGLTKWLRANAGKAVTQFDVAAIFNEAYAKAATISNAATGFRSSRRWPIDRPVLVEQVITLA